MARYEEIADVIRLRISDGTWPPGAKIPIQDELVAEFGVSYGTVHRAISLLKRQGAVRTAHDGTYAGEPTSSEPSPEEA